MKKTLQRLMFSGLGLSLILLLSGCVQTKNGQPTGKGFVYKFLVEPMGHAITYFVDNWHWSYGLAIVGVTVIVRLLILPLGLYQAYKASYQQEKMNYMKPILKPLQDKMKNAATPEEKLAANQEMMKVQRDNGVSMFGGIGCLPLLIQMPFFSALFYAARYTKGIDTSTFFGINLGKSSITLVLIAGVLYFLQSYISMFGMDKEQKAQMKTMMFMSPLMIMFMSWSAPAGVTLYWVVGGIFGVVQQIIITFMIKPHLRKRIDKEFAEKPPVVKDKNYIKDVTPIESAPKKAQKISQTSNKGRNAGKQQKKK